MGVGRAYPANIVIRSLSFPVSTTTAGWIYTILLSQVLKVLTQ